MLLVGRFDTKSRNNIVCCISFMLLFCYIFLLRFNGRVKAITDSEIVSLVYLQASDAVGCIS